MRKVNWLSVFKKTFKDWNEDDPFKESAVVAYYAIFSLPALLVVVINVAGLFFERGVVSGEVSRQISGLMGKETADSIGKIVEAASKVKAGIIPSIIAVVTILFGASGVFLQLQKSLNQIWDVKQVKDHAFMREIKHRLFSFGIILSLGFLMLVSLTVSSVLTAFSHWLQNSFSDGLAAVMFVVDFVISLGIISCMFALMFKYLPDAKTKWRYVWPGAILTAVLFIAGKYALSFYFGKAHPASVYGAAGSIVLVLLWVSYSSMILFFGAEFTKQLSVAREGSTKATHGAAKMTVDQNGQPVQEKPGAPRSESSAPQDNEKKKHMKKVKDMKFLDEEIARKKIEANIHLAELKDQLRPAKLLFGLRHRHQEGHSPADSPVKAEALNYVLRLIADKVLLRKANWALKPLSHIALGIFSRKVTQPGGASWLKDIALLFKRKHRDSDSSHGHRSAT